MRAFTQKLALVALSAGVLTSHRSVAAPACTAVYADSAPVKYPRLLKMLPKYKPENKRWLFRVKYLETAEEREPYRVVARDGLLYHSTGELLGQRKEEELIYVMDARGNIFAGPAKLARFHHSSFLGGSDVAAAGHIKISNGRVTWISLESGHYHPRAENLLQALRELSSRGVKVRPSVISPYEMSATEYEWVRSSVQSSQLN